MARVLSCAIVGLDGALIEVEVDIAPGLPSFTIVGLPDAAVQEAKDRVRAAIRNTGYQFPMKRITANLAPADLKKVGPSYDLPIAIGISRGHGPNPGFLAAGSEVSRQGCAQRSGGGRGTGPRRRGAPGKAGGAGGW